MKKNPSSKCSPDLLAIKSYFLGPQSENSDWLRHSILEILDNWFQWRKDIRPKDGCAISRSDQLQTLFRLNQDKVSSHLKKLNTRFQQEIPQFSPRYIGHMYSEIALPALLGHFTALLHNPNIISSEAARVGAHVEEEAIKSLAQMLGYSRKQATGHFTSGGTVANIEALWRARYKLDHFLALTCYLNLEKGTRFSYFDTCKMTWKKYDGLLKKYKLNESSLRKYSPVANNGWQLFYTFKKAFAAEYKGPIVLVPNSKHYSWLKAISLLGLGEESFWSVELDSNGIMSIPHLKLQIARAKKEDRPIAMLVSVAGTTELGEVDPIHQIQNELKKLKLPIWHHIDAAYGGFFCSLTHRSEYASLLDQNIYKALKAVRFADSVTLDPHKLGYVPYACGAIVVKNDLNYRISAFDAKYIQSPDKEIDRWMKTLEGSRGGTGAAATWMTLQTIGVSDYARILQKTIKTRNFLAQAINNTVSDAKVLKVPSTNLLCFSVSKKCKTLSQMNRMSEKVEKEINSSNEFFVSKTHLKDPEYRELIKSHCKMCGVKYEANIGLSLIRLTIMNPFFDTKETQINFRKHFVKILNNVI